MQIAVTYKDGVLIPQKSLNLRQSHLVVSIPDEMLKSVEQDEKVVRLSMRERISRILGRHARSRSEVNAEADKEVWQQHLLDKYLSNE